jgi:hypothetical protein
MWVREQGAYTQELQYASASKRYHFLNMVIDTSDFKTLYTLTALRTVQKLILEIFKVDDSTGATQLNLVYNSDQDANFPAIVQDEI